MAGRSFRIRGLDCAEEVAALRRGVGPLVGGDQLLAFDLLRGRMTVGGEAAAVPTPAIERAVENAGLRAEPWEEEPRPDGALRQRRAALAAASGALVLAGFAAHAAAEGWGAALGAASGATPHLVRLLYLGAVVAGGWLVLPRAWSALRRGRADMNLLMTVAVVGAIAIGEWLEAGVVAFLFSLSLALEAWSLARARRAVAALLDLAPATARVKDPAGVERLVPAADVAVGSLVVVKPGERVPLDARVVRGRSAVDQAPITGESLPVEKAVGDEVYAGTINGDGALEVECLRPFADSTLARIIRLVEEAESRRSPSERWVDRFARWYTPAVLGLAAAVGLVPPLVLDGGWVGWLYRALVLLVIACPCALVISTPVTIVAAVTSAARRGVLVKGGASLEAPARLRVVAFDKTGTLTVGRPVVTAVVPLGGHDEREVLERAAALEVRSEHPLARAIVAHAHARGVPVEPAEEVTVLQGRGVTGRVGGRPYWLGSHRHLVERRQATPEVERRLSEMSAAGNAVVVVGHDEHVCGLIAVADGVRPEAAAAVAALRALGIERLVMLTGDNRPTAESSGRQVGVDEVRAELLPADKAAAVEELVAAHGRVAMVGDGVNDAPAMARAPLSIAMGAAGSDAAIEIADVALMADDLRQLPWLVRHSRRALRAIRLNVAVSLVVKAAFVVLTLSGRASLWAAIAADMGASLLVIANGMRLLRSPAASEAPAARQ